MNSQRPIFDCQLRRTASTGTWRAGLAPLELVLSLPLLLLVMALIVNFAHAATWKIRSATSARLAMWRHRPMWSADNDPNPVNFWPKGAALGVKGGARVTEVDPVWNQSAIAQAWIKGPVFVAGNGYLAVRNNRVNEMSEGVSVGTGTVAQRYPFIPGMGFMNMRAENTLLDSVWQYHTMGYGLNTDRRAKGWWQVEESADWTSEKRDFLDADSKMVNNSQRDLMRPLDRDVDLMAFYANSPPNWDFYTKVDPNYCKDDPEEVRKILADPGSKLDQIRGVRARGTPGVNERMAKSYLQMYQAELNILQAQDNPPAERVALLKMWIKQLNDFIATLP